MASGSERGMVLGMVDSKPSLAPSRVSLLAQGAVSLYGTGYSELVGTVDWHPAMHIYPMPRHSASLCKATNYYLSQYRLFM